MWVYMSKSRLQCSYTEIKNLNETSKTKTFLKFTKSLKRDNNDLSCLYLVYILLNFIIIVHVKPYLQYLIVCIVVNGKTFNVMQ